MDLRAEFSALFERIVKEHDGDVGYAKEWVQAAHTNPIIVLADMYKHTHKDRSAG